MSDCMALWEAATEFLAADDDVIWQRLKGDPDSTAWASAHDRLAHARKTLNRVLAEHSVERVE